MMDATTVLVFMTGPALMVAAVLILAVYLGLEGVGAEIRVGLTSLGIEVRRAWALQDVAATVPARVDATGCILSVSGLGGTTKIAMHEQMRPGSYLLHAVPLTSGRVTGA